MSWQTWTYDGTENSETTLAKMILNLMNEVVYDLPTPDLNEWCDAGIEIEGVESGDEAVIVYYEMQETDMTDIDGIYKPGYTLTIQMCDGQQDTETFFADDSYRWEDLSKYFAHRVVERA